MFKNRMLSIIFGIIGAVLVIGGLYVVISYLSYIGQGIIAFASSNNLETISKCGIVVPDMFLDMSDKFATTLVPILYLGIPIAVVLISVLWFLSGYYFGKSRIEEEHEGREKRKKEVEEEVQKRVGKKKKEEPE